MGICACLRHKEQETITPFSQRLKKHLLVSLSLSPLVTSPFWFCSVFFPFLSFSLCTSSSCPSHSACLQSLLYTYWNISLIQPISQVQHSHASLGVYMPWNSSGTSPILYKLQPGSLSAMFLARLGRHCSHIHTTFVVSIYRCLHLTSRILTLRHSAYANDWRELLWPTVPTWLTMGLWISLAPSPGSIWYQWILVMLPVLRMPVSKG